MPFIHQVQGGPGAQLHIVAPEKLEVAPVASSGAQIGRNEFILFADAAITNSGTNLRFAGKAGYACDGALALFEGTHLEMNGLGLSLSNGDFGASVKLTGPRTLEGRVAGRAGGTLRLHLPAGFGTKGVRVRFDGHDAPAAAGESTLVMPVAIKQSNGVKIYSITAL